MSQTLLVYRLEKMLGKKYKHLDELVNSLTVISNGGLSKYNNMRILYKDITYHSLSEAVYAFMLDKLLLEKRIKHIKRQIRFPLADMDGKMRLAYIADFIVTRLDNIEIVIDVKGRLTADNKVKLAYFTYVYKKPVTLVSTTGSDKFDLSFLIV